MMSSFLATKASVFRKRSRNSQERQQTSFQKQLQWDEVENMQVHIKKMPLIILMQQLFMAILPLNKMNFMQLHSHECSNLNFHHLLDDRTTRGNHVLEMYFGYILTLTSFSKQILSFLKQIINIFSTRSWQLSFSIHRIRKRIGRCEEKSVLDPLFSNLTL